MKSPKSPGTLAGRVEVRQILDDAARQHGGSVSRQRAYALEDHEDFPPPVDVLEDGRRPVWNRQAIVDYAAKRPMAPGRPPADRVDA